jgi:hypothetical protein
MKLVIEVMQRPGYLTVISAIERYGDACMSISRMLSTL